MIAGLQNPVNLVKDITKPGSPHGGPAAADFAATVNAVKSGGGAGAAQAAPLFGTLLPVLPDQDMQLVMRAAAGQDVGILNPTQNYAVYVVNTLRENGVPVSNDGTMHLREDVETARLLAQIIANYPFAEARGNAFPGVYPPEDFAANLEGHVSPDFIQLLQVHVDNHGRARTPGMGP